MAYSKWDKDYWQGRAREVLGRDREAVEAWHWLVASKHAASIGVYRVPWRAMATDLFFDSSDHAREVVARLVEKLGPGSIRLKGDDVFVVGMATRQHAAINSDMDRRRRGRELADEIEAARRSPFWPEFVAMHGRHLFIHELETVKTDTPMSVSGRASEGLPAFPEARPDPYPSHPIPYREGMTDRGEESRATSATSDQAGRQAPPEEPEAPDELADFEAYGLDEQALTVTDPVRRSGLSPKLAAVVGPLLEVTSRVVADYELVAGMKPGSRRVPRPVARAVCHLRRTGMDGQAIEAWLAVYVRFHAQDERWRRNKGRDWLLEPESLFGAGIGPKSVAVTGRAIDTASVLAERGALAQAWHALQTQGPSRNAPVSRAPQPEVHDDPEAAIAESRRLLAATKAKLGIA